MRPDLSQVAVVADVVADAALFEQQIVLRLAGEFLGKCECLEDRARVLLATAKIVDLSAAGLFQELRYEADHVTRVNVVANLFSLVTVNLVLTALHIAADQITKKTMQLDGGMVWTRQASATQAAGRHPETSTILLHQDIGREFRSPKNRVRGLINGEILRNSIEKAWIREIPAER